MYRHPPVRRGRVRAPLLVVLALFVVVPVALFVSSRHRKARWPDPVRPATAVGDSTCISCHRDKASFEGTAHRLTMQHPSRATIAGSFAPGQNVLRTPNPDLYFHMNADSAGFTQTGVLRHGRDSTTRTERIALVSGIRKGQSYLYWAGNRLYQLPVSYWASLGKWINSPGYVDGGMNFERAVSPRCFECHSTWIQSVNDPGASNRYDTTGAIVGITCERCHGAGREHVARERSVLRAMNGPAIVNPARLSRQRQMDACAQCHGGLGQPIAPLFTYVAGQPLERYLSLPPVPANAILDVHGNQVSALMRSRCYQASQMTCITCHDVHQTQRDPKDLSGRCLACHQEQSCKLFPKEGHALKGRCVDCHMPLQESNLIDMGLEGKEKRELVRTHWIRVWPDSAIKH
jgi:Cytochrome c554 and c-prime